MLSWNVEQNGWKWREFSGSTGWVMFILCRSGRSLVDRILVLKHCIHASIFPAVWGSENGFASEFDHAQCSHQRRWRRRVISCHKRSCRFQIEDLKWVFETSNQFLNCFALLLSIEKRQEDIGRRPCMPFSIWSYQPMWFLTMPLSVHVRKDITGKAPGSSTWVSDMFLQSLIPCRLASKWNDKLQSISICMSSHAQNLICWNVHSCQWQNCSCSFCCSVECRCLLDGIDLRSIQPNMISFNSSLSACEPGQQKFQEMHYVTMF